MGNTTQDGCKYCKGEKKTAYKQIGFTKPRNTRYRHSDIVEYPDFGKTCSLQIIGDKLCINYDAYSTDSSFSDDIKINYCPICGRKLCNNNQ